MRKWILWIPVLMVGSMIYWTIALNFGGLSLLALSTYAVPASAMDDLNDLRDSYQPITVNLTGADETAKAEADSEDEAVDVDVVSDHDRDTARSDQRGAGDRNGRGDTGPGETAY
ncbi:MAG TPA: hypothetical protein VGP07_17220 [Polyangia bacterium]|jgi:hypothetical protein